MSSTASTNQTEAQADADVELASQVEELADHDAVPEEVEEILSTLIERDERSRERIDQLEERNRQLCERVEQLEQTHRDDRNHAARERAEDRKRITNVEDRLDDLEDGHQHSDGQDTDSGDTVEPQTHLEDVASVPPRLTEDLHPNVKRSLFVARDVVDYSTSVREGRVIKWSQLGTVLEAGCDNSYPATISRVMEILDDFGEDETKIVDKEHLEKRVWFSDETVARLDELCGDEPDATHSVVSRGTG